MKIIRFIFVLVLVAGIAIALITTRPSEKEFASWYVEQNQTGMGGLFDEAFKTIVEQRTETEDYLIFSVFELDEETRYVGVLDHFFGRNTIEDAKETLNNLVEQVKQAVEEG